MAAVSRNSALLAAVTRAIALRAEKDRDFTAHVDVTHDRTLAGDANALPAPNRDVFAESTDQRRPLIFDRARAAWIRQRQEVCPVLRSEGRLRHLVHEGQVVLVASGEVGLDVHLDDDAALAIAGDAGEDHPFCRNGAGALGAFGQALLENDLDGLVHVALGFRQGRTTIVEARLGTIPKLFDLLHVHLSHRLPFREDRWGLGRLNRVHRGPRT